jgi:hypothetical protein
MELVICVPLLGEYFTVTWKLCCLPADVLHNLGTKMATDEQTDMQIWDRKRIKMKNLQKANLMSKKPKNTTDEQTDMQQICNMT